MIDAVGAADRLATAVTEATDAALASASAPPGPVFVGWVAATDAASFASGIESHAQRSEDIEAPVVPRTDWLR